MISREMVVILADLEYSAQSTDRIFISTIVDSIHEIETYYRPGWFRVVEYVFFTSNCIANWVIKKPVRNITIGRYQVGILNHLKYLGRSVPNVHKEYINKVSIQEFYEVMKLLSLDQSNKVT